MRAELDTSMVVGDFAKVHEQCPFESTLAEVAKGNLDELFEQDYYPVSYKQSQSLPDEADSYHELRTNDFHPNEN